MSKREDRAQSFAGATRPPDWRYRQAMQAVSSGRVLFASRVDQETLNLTRFLQDESEYVNEAARHRNQNKYPALAAAVAIYRDPRGVLASHIEALILARESTKEISTRTTVPENVIVLYRNCFFSVGELLDDRGYILRYAMRVRQGLHPDLARRHAAMKLLAYCCGANAIQMAFLAGEEFPREKWQSQSTLLQRIAANADWQIVFDLVESTAACSPLKVREQWEQILSRAKAVETVGQPKNILDRLAQ